MKVEVVLGDITEQDVDAIVNAANEDLLPGGGVCGAIFRKAGFSQLQKACQSLGHVDTGDAKATPGFGLKARYIIHAVGPVYRGGKFDEASLLKSAYLRALQVAEELRLNTIAFPAISTGIFGFSLTQASEIALNALLGAEVSLSLARIVCIKQNVFEEFLKSFKRLTKGKD